jgi:DNA-nicking Smr family endonuclease
MTGVAPLRLPEREPRRNRRAQALTRAEESRATAGPAEVLPAAPPIAMPPPATAFAGVDRRTADRVRRGRYPVEAGLDLHGMTQAEAHRALSGFLVDARDEGRRCVLVITGHGRISGGVLKTAVPRWLAEPDFRAHVLAIAPARPQHGGAGALYVLLRRSPRLSE